MHLIEIKKKVFHIHVKHLCPLFVCSELSLKTAHEHLSTYPKSANRNKRRLFFSSAEMCKKPL